MARERASATVPFSQLLFLALIALVSTRPNVAEALNCVIGECPAYSANVTDCVPIVRLPTTNTGVRTLFYTLGKPQARLACAPGSRPTETAALQFTVARSGIFTLTTSATLRTSVDTVIEVRDCNGVSMGCNDDFPGKGLYSQLTLPLIVGQQYVAFLQGTSEAAIYLTFASAAPNTSAPTASTASPTSHSEDALAGSILGIVLAVVVVVVLIIVFTACRSHSKSKRNLIAKQAQDLTELNQQEAALRELEALELGGAAKERKSTVKREQRMREKNAKELEKRMALFTKNQRGLETGASGPTNSALGTKNKTKGKKKKETNRLASNAGPSPPAAPEGADFGIVDLFEDEEEEKQLPAMTSAFPSSEFSSTPFVASSYFSSLGETSGSSEATPTAPLVRASSTTPGGVSLSPGAISFVEIDLSNNASVSHSVFSTARPAPTLSTLAGRTVLPASSSVGDAETSFGPSGTAAKHSILETTGAAPDTASVFGSSSPAFTTGKSVLPTTTSFTSSAFGGSSVATRSVFESVLPTTTSSPSSAFGGSSVATRSVFESVLPTTTSSTSSAFGGSSVATRSVFETVGTPPAIELNPPASTAGKAVLPQTASSFISEFVIEPSPSIFDTLGSSAATASYFESIGMPSTERRTYFKRYDGNEDLREKEEERAKSEKNEKDAATSLALQ